MSNQKSRVKVVNRSMRALDDKLQPGTYVNNHRATEQSLSQLDPGTHFPGSRLAYGHWLPKNPLDEQINTKYELASGDYTKIKDIDDSTAKWVVSKKQQEQYKTLLKAAEWTYDRKDPRTQDDMYALIPELKTIPERYHADQLALMEQLRVLINDGRVRSQDDLALLIRVCRNDFQLPLAPAWDPQGIIMGIDDEYAGFKKKYTQQRRDANSESWLRLSWWGPLLNNEGGGAYLMTDDPQAAFKRAILMRCLPGLRTAEEPDQEIGRFLNQINLSDMTGSFISPLNRGENSNLFEKAFNIRSGEYEEQLPPPPP